jgi:hypothetical protein
MAYCCNGTECDGGRFNLQELIPGKLAEASPDPSTGQKSKRNVYCPTQERPYLDFQLIKWLQQAHQADPCHAVCPPDLILSETQRRQRASLVRADPKTLKSTKDITVLLQESDDWGDEWSAILFEVITQFESDYWQVMKQKKHKGKGA